MWVPCLLFDCILYFLDLFWVDCIWLECFGCVVCVLCCYGCLFYCVVCLVVVCVCLFGFCFVACVIGYCGYLLAGLLSFSFVDLQCVVMWLVCVLSVCWVWGMFVLVVGVVDCF